MRHSDGGRCAIAALTGERVQEILGHVIDEQGDDEVSIKPASRKLGILRGQPVKAQKALQALEREFDLPSQAIKRQHALGRVLIPIKRGEKEQVPGCGERLGMRLPAPLHRTLVRPVLALAGGSCVFA